MVNPFWPSLYPATYNEEKAKKAEERKNRIKALSKASKRKNRT